jgi:hypothetical protein
MVANRWTLCLLPLLVLALIPALASCGSLTSPTDPPAAASERDTQASPLAQLSPLPTPTSEPAPKPIELVVLHTNDNWGETEPCG